MDVRMPRMDGIEATRAIVAHSPERAARARVTTFEHDEYVYDALRAGASGFVLKTASSRGSWRRPSASSRAGESLVSPALHAPARRAARDSASTPSDRAALLLGAAHRPRGGDAAAGRARPVEPGDRRRVRGRRPHGEDARRAHAREARGARPHAGGRAGLRDRVRAAGRVAGSDAARASYGFSPRRRQRWGLTPKSRFSGDRPPKKPSRSSRRAHRQAAAARGM